MGILKWGFLLVSADLGLGGMSIKDGKIIKGVKDIKREIRIVGRMGEKGATILYKAKTSNKKIYIGSYHKLIFAGQELFLYYTKFILLFIVEY